MKNFVLLFAIVFLFACEKESTTEVLPEQEVTTSTQNATPRDASLVTICHHTGSANNPWVMIEVNENALPAHLDQGDGYPGECVPNTTGARFDANCVVISDCSCFTDGLLSVEVNTGQETYTIYLNTTDDNSDIQWSPDFTFLGATDDWDGQGNTSTIVSHYDGQLVDRNTYAAGICAELAATTGCDWYLPSKEELNTMIKKFGSSGTSGNAEMSFGLYWSSTEYDASEARFHDFTDDHRGFISKGNSFRCRCVRR